MDQTEVRKDGWSAQGPLRAVERESELQQLHALMRAVNDRDDPLTAAEVDELLGL